MSSTTCSTASRPCAPGQQINDSGASSAVDFNDNDGMIKSRDFQLWEIDDGKDETIERIAS